MVNFVQYILILSLLIVRAVIKGLEPEIFPGNFLLDPPLFW